MVQPAQPEGQQFGDSSEPTQVVQQQQGSDPQGESPNAESTQLVAPESQPQPAIPYAPPPSAADNPAVMNPQGAFGQQPPGGFGQQPGAPGGFGAPPQQPGQPAFGGQPGGFPPQGGFGAPPPGQPFGGPPPGYGGPPPGYGGPPPGGSNKMIAWIAGGVTAALGLVVAILAITLLSDLSGGGGDIDDVISGCVEMSGMSEEQCREAAQHVEMPEVSTPGHIYFYVIMLLVGGLIALAGGVMHALADRMGAGLKKIIPYLTIAGGFLPLLFSILLMTEGGGAFTRIVFTLIFGILVLAVGVLAVIPQTAGYVGLGGPGGPGGFGPPGQFGGFGPPSGGFAQPGQPGGFGPPSGGFAQPGGQYPPSGGFGQPGQPGLPPQQPSGFGGPPPGQPGQPGGFGQPGHPGAPPQQW